MLPPEWAITLAVTLVVVATVAGTTTRIYLFTVAVTIPYAVGAYIAATHELRYYPYAPAETYWRATQLQLASLMALTAVGLASGLAERFTTTARWVFASRPPSWTVRRGALHLVWIGTGSIAVHDFVVLAQNYAAIREANRHNFDSVFIVGNGGIGITIALALTAVLVYSIAVDRYRSKVNAAMLLLLWGPKILSGNRLYLLMGVAICELAFFCTCRRRRLRRTVAVGTAAAIVLFFFLPTLWVPDPLIGFNEWIMPNSLFVSAVSGAVTPDSLGVDPFWSRAATLLVGPLRPHQVVNFADAFTELGVVGVAVGGNPWADVFTDSPGWSVVSFILATLTLQIAGLVATRLSPAAIIVTFALLMVWGRSLFWETLSIIIYTSLVTWPVFRRCRARGAPMFVVGANSSPASSGPQPKPLVT